MKECHTYSQWYPRGYERVDSITEFDDLWHEITTKEIPELPKFFVALITYIESNMNIKSDSEKDKHLWSLINIYAFLNPDQKKDFLIEFCGLIAQPLQNFIENFLSVPKEKINLLGKQLWVLDMLLEHASGGSSIGALSLKNMLNQKIDEYIQNQHLEEAIKEMLVNQNENDVSMVSDTSSASDKVEDLRKMFESVLIQPVDMKQVASQIKLFESVYNLLLRDPITLPFFLLKTPETDQTQIRLNANLVMHLSNIMKCQIEADSDVGRSIQAYENANDTPLNVLLANLDNIHYGSEVNVHQNAYRELLIISIEWKILQASKQLNDSNPKKSGVKFEIVMGKNETKMIIENEEEKVEDQEDKPTLDDFQIDTEQALNSISHKIGELKDQATQVAGQILKSIVRESRWYGEISQNEESILIRLILSYLSVEKEDNSAKSGIKILFENDDITNDNKEYITFLDTILQVLNSGYMAKELGQSMGKNKSTTEPDLSKMKAMKRRILVRHYCPLMYIVKDSKSKQDYLLNPNIDKEMVSLVRDLCSLQRLIMAFVNLNASLLALIKPKILELNGMVVSNQLKMLVGLVENPTTRFLNHPNIGHKWQNIVNMYVSAISSEMSPINILNEVQK